MKKTKFFFWRWDIPKKICLIALVPLFFLTFWTWIGFRLGFLLIPLFVFDLIICLIPIRVPGEKSIEKMLSEYYDDHCADISNRLSKDTRNNLVVFKGFSDEKAKFNRKIGKKAIFPVCRTLGFAFKDEKAMVFLRDSALWEGLKCESIELEISCKKPAKVTRLSYEEGTNINLLAFCINDQTFRFCVKNRFEITETLEAHKDFFIIDI